MKHLFYITLSILTLFVSCRDEMWDDYLDKEGSTSIMAKEATNSADNSGLILLNDGTWKATRRVPLTGVGRMIGNMSPGLVSVINGSKGLGCIVDDDLTNKASMSGAVSANAIFGQIVSVKDLYRTYSGGQQAGFVYEVDNSGLLTADVLKLFTLTLYNNGKLLKTFNLSESGEVLGLNLINVSTADGQSQQALSVDVPVDMNFDEIAFGVGGVDAAVLEALHIYYAFVGETPIRTTVKGTPNAYANASIYKGVEWSNWALQEQLVDSDPNNGPVIELLGGLLNGLGGGFRTTINFGEPIPAGSEVGFVYSTGNLLNLGVGNTIKMSTYNEDPDNGAFHKADPPIEEYTVGSVLGASLIGGGKGANSFVATKSFQNIHLFIIGLNVKLGAIQYHYAYTRAKTDIDVTSYFNFPESMTVTTSGCQIVQPEQGTLTVQITDQPSQANASYLADKGRLSGMTVDGDYRITFNYSLNGKSFTQHAVIHKTSDSKDAASGCNTLVTKGSITSGTDGGNLLCLICGTAKNPEYLLDGNVNTCMVHYGALELIENNNIVTVNKIQLADTTMLAQGYNAGFIVQVSKELLNLNALNYLYVDLYKNGQKLKRQVSGTRPTIDLGLLNGDQGKMRVGVTVPAGTPAFDEIRLYNAGIAALNFNTLRLYGIFYEPNGTSCARNGVSEACMELLTPANSGASINYEQTSFKGLAGVAQGMYSLDNIMDDDKETFATLPLTSVAGGMSLSIKFNEMPANQWVGLMIQNMGAVADVKLLQALVFSAYDKGRKVCSTVDDKELLNLSVVSHGDKSFLELMPDQPFDEIRLTNAGVVGALEQLKVYGAYIRVDLDRDGIPDCGEGQGTDVSDDKIFPVVKEVHVCEGNEVAIPVSGGKAGDYKLSLRRYEDEMLTNKISEEERTVSYNGQGVIFLGKGLAKSVYLIDFSLPGETSPYYTNLKVFVHPRQTTWLGVENSDWNHWRNWKEGAPWKCSDVVVPAGCQHYPILKRGEKNVCARIQFGSNAQGEMGEVVNTQYLDYSSAWVDLALKGGDYHLLAAPLKATYTGDVFAKESYRGAADEAIAYQDAWKIYTNPADLVGDFRFNPQVYQYTFGGIVNNMTESGMEELRPGSKDWTPAFNLVAESYLMGCAYLVRMGEEPVSNVYRIRWPKRYEMYDYYDLQTHESIAGRKEQVDRIQAGRFCYEDANGNVNFPLRIIRKNDRPGDLFLFGNPFMAHLSVQKFFDANVGVGEVRVLRNNKYVVWHRGEKGQINPMEGFFIKLRSPYSERNRYQYYIHLTEDMLEQKTM